MTETQVRINEILHLDYDTFINASFFLQGKADEFTQKNSTQRKEILASILGMDVWEHYRDLTRETRRMLENRMRVIEGTLVEIEAELAQEPQRKEALAEAREALKALEQQRQDQQKNYDQAHKLVELMQEQRNALDELENSGVELKTKQIQISQQLAQRQIEEKELTAVLHEAEQIKQDFATRTSSKNNYSAWMPIGHYYRSATKKERCRAIHRGGGSRLSQELRSLIKRNEDRANERYPAGDGEEKGQLAEELVQLQQDEKRLATFTEEKSALNEQKRRCRQKIKICASRCRNWKNAGRNSNRIEGSTCPLCGQR